MAPLAKPLLTLCAADIMMMEAPIHRVIVVDGVSHRPIGIVSSTDILAAVARADPASTQRVPDEENVMADVFY